MKILYLAPYYKPAWKLGGPVFAVSGLCESLIRLGHDVEVFTTDIGGKNERLRVSPGVPCNIDSVKVTYLRGQGYWRFFFAPSLISLLKQRVPEFDLVHISGTFTFFHMAWALCLRNTQIPFVVSPRGAFMSNAMKREFLKNIKKELYRVLVESRVLERASGVHCMTEMEEKAVLRYFPGVKTFVIPNQVSVDTFTPVSEGNLFRQELNISESAFVFLYLGRLHPHKGIDLSIKAFAELAEKHANVQLIIAGGTEAGTDRQWRNLADSSGVSDRVHFLGQVAGKRKLQCFTGADAFLLNSYSENFGISCAEAIICGLPVIVSDQTGLADWVLRHQAGLVVPQDVSRITEAMLSIIDNYPSHKAHAIKSAELAREEFSPHGTATRMLQVYKRCAMPVRT
ncbi:glycosyltransferase [Desulfomonile tiedjei]|uniref:Glycosyltransferase n=1 Tax=Desulfomonile tiedjei (strain ATCC 49306 / DSM 6799 / DCB-1) TaxID=706587 RepID=I4BZN3_DESTA|nr:glycosyltransferase [Desulfomonile tiedjei]AFM22774.1 glycosyltransferase [Desulfomonile tiedjei DSM 6799]